MLENRIDFAELSRKIEERKEKFEAFYELLLFYNAKFNLTAITQREDVFHKHFLDSLSAEPYLPQNAKCAEVGSGAGFPSIPLMLARDDLSFTLIESVGKKCAFLREAVRELSLNAEIAQTRAETAGRDPAFRERADVCVARAVARLNTLAEYCMPLVKVGGRFLAYKGEAEEEVREGAAAVALLGGKAETVRYELPRGYGRRTLVVVRKERRTPEKYPRGQGAERRDPLR